MVWTDFKHLLSNFNLAGEKYRCVLKTNIFFSPEHCLPCVHGLIGVELAIPPRSSE